MIDATEVRRVIDYDAVAGTFYWRVKMSDKIKAGYSAGSVNVKGYHKIRIKGKTYAAHRLAWLYVHGKWPVCEIDHKDRNKLNNKIDNLREATKSQNSKNKDIPTTNKSGVKGVMRRPSGKWEAFIWDGGSQHYLGLHACFGRAVQARKSAEIQMFGEFR